MGASFRIKNTINMVKAKKISDKAFIEGQSKAAIQMLTWMANGSIATQKAPPIREGILASSGSVFYKNKLLGVSPDRTGGKATPNRDYNSKNITWGFNTAYATRMHEDKTLKPGPYSQANSNRHPGNEWAREHLNLDKNNYTALVAKFAGKYL